MGFRSERPARVGVRVVVLAAVGYAGLAASITLMFLGMRAVMDIGGFCAEGGPYVIAHHCPDAAVPASFGGVFGLLLFGGIAWGYGVRIGGIWGAVPIIGWIALFGVMGWNFLEYGLFSPPEGAGIDVGWVICGVTFWITAAVPLLGLLGLNRLGLAVGGPRTVEEGLVADPADPADLVESVESEQEATAALRSALTALPVTAASDSERAQLAAIAASFDAAIAKAEAETPIDPAARGASGPSVVMGEGDFSEGTQALLDRLERLGDMRDRGLLDTAEYETAKDAIVRELEVRS